MSTPTAPAAPGPKRRPRTTGGVNLGQDAGREARRLATAVLEVLAGMRTPAAAAQALQVSLPRYYHLESRALRGLVAGCQPRPQGRRPDSGQELAGLRRDKERLQRELARQQALVRLAQRTIGLAPPPAPVMGKTAGKRRRRPLVRALSVAAHLRAGEPTAPAPDAPDTKAPPS
jgi:hypothetical protein